jgi:hypothetical protein
MHFDVYLAGINQPNTPGPQGRFALKTAQVTTLMKRSFSSR